MKRKRDKKYFLTFGTVFVLVIIMIISLCNKNTYSTCYGNDGICCRTKDSFSDDFEHDLEELAWFECTNYAGSMLYENYTCNIIETSNGNFKWELIFYTDCQK